MFGTTETQRAVSYYALPPVNEDSEYLGRMPDVIPAGTSPNSRYGRRGANTYLGIGRGMKNVQLLVVDRTSLEQSKPRLCGIGEQGEIFVRAAGKFDVNQGLEPTYSSLSTCISGLAEGYLGSDLNKEKFIPNFFLKNPNMWQEDEKRNLDSAGQEEPWRKFWKGPRDRLYRHSMIAKT